AGSSSHAAARRTRPRTVRRCSLNPDRTDRGCPATLVAGRSPPSITATALLVAHVAVRQIIAVLRAVDHGTEGGSREDVGLDGLAQRRIHLVECSGVRH